MPTVFGRQAPLGRFFVSENSWYAVRQVSVCRCRHAGCLRRGVCVSLVRGVVYRARRVESPEDLGSRSSCFRPWFRSADVFFFTFLGERKRAHFAASAT